jgi:hypothetical protein
LASGYSEMARTSLSRGFLSSREDPGRSIIFDLEKSSTLLYALKFMLYMALVDLVVHVPLAAKLGINLQSGFFILLFVVEAYVEYLATGLILHGAMKLFGGKGRLQACIAAYCFLTAYLPLISVLMLPTQMLVVPVIAQSSNFPQDLYQLAAQAAQLTAWDRFSLLLSFLLTTVVFVLFFKSVFGTFRALHELSKARAIFAFIGGFGLFRCIDGSVSNSLPYRDLPRVCTACNGPN